MKQLVRNLGDYFDLPINEIADLNLDEFVNAAIKVEAGELGTLRVSLSMKFICLLRAGRILNQSFLTQ